MIKKSIAIFSFMLVFVLASGSTAMAQVATGNDGGGLDTFAPFGKEGQILAQATCAAMRETPGFTFAVQRICVRNNTSCEEICANLSGQQQPPPASLSCFGALHIYADPFFTSDQMLGLKTLTQTDCSITNCGPNYCCCGN